MTTVSGASIALLAGDSLAQLKAPPDDIDAETRTDAKLRAKAGAVERRDTRRIPVIDANANATFRSSQLIGTNITDADGRAIGKIVDFVSDSRGNIQFP
ncbi:MAG: PRC-barrel domain-containing protein, partial [Planctomycetales bacterium]|nr:PRC-barrel domain-containing protein [Planctomycetales bacterium]